MRFFQSILIGLAFILLLSAPRGLRAEPAPLFSHPGVERDADRYVETLVAAARALPAKMAPSDLLAAAGRSSTQGDQRGVIRSLALAAGREPANGAVWLSLAQALLAIKPEQAQGAERYELPVSASAAAYTALRRSTTPADKARALSVLSEALVRRSMYRPAIEALKASVGQVDDTETHAALDKLIAEHGFRVADYKVDSEATPPRLCIEFSDPLDRNEAEIAKFVSVDGHDPQSMVQEGKQLCVEGLEHGKRYEVQLREGLPSSVGEKLIKTASLGVYVRDRKAGVRFQGKAYVLPARGQQGLPVTTINTKRLAIEVYRVGDRALASVVEGDDWQRDLRGREDDIKTKTGVKVYSGELDVVTRLNAEVTTAIPVSEALGTLKPGVYVASARPADQAGGSEQDGATQWFIVSDLGLTALSGDDGLNVFVRSLTAATPTVGTKVKLLARDNEILGTTTTDANGHARFDVALMRGEGGAAPSLLVAEGDHDYGFLDLTSQAFDLSDRGVKGREPPGKIDAYLYADRGVYRPGETVHLSGLVRDANGEASGVPMTLIIQRPDGVEASRTALLDQGLGGRVYNLALPATAMPGTWRVKLHADPKADPQSETAFLVEDYVPERLDMTIGASVKALVPEVEQQIDVKGRYLYGAPAADLALDGEVVVDAASDPLPGFAGYAFGRSEEKVAAVKATLEGVPRTDAAGEAKVGVRLPAIPRTDRPLQATVRFHLAEPGGRVLTRSITLPVDTHTPKIGIRPTFTATGLAEDEPATFDVVYLDASGKAQGDTGLTWTLSRLDTTWQWYRRNGAWSYESAVITRKVGSGSAKTAVAQPARITTKVSWGRYRLEVTQADGKGPVSSVDFSSGWYSADKPDTPEVLEVALDKPMYKVGDTAKLRVQDRLGGRALVGVLGSGAPSLREVEFPKGASEISVPVDDTVGAGGYITAIVFRPMDESLKRMPSRALGLTWLKVDNSARELKVALGAPAHVKPGTHLDVPVTITGLAAGDSARVTLAAVDVGILNLTRFEAPAPEKWFLAQRKLGVEIRDLYGRLIDGMHAERGRLRSGGDGGGGLATEGSPPVEAPFALFSGIVPTKPDGTALIPLDLPDFNGQVRLMVVAWSKTATGHGVEDVTVADKVALTAAAPRFLTLGDETRVRLDLHNVEAEPIKVEVSALEDQGGTSREVLKTSVELKPQERRAEEVRLQPKSIGALAYDLKVTGPGGLNVKRHLVFDVKPPSGEVKRTTVSELKPGGKVTLTADLVTDLIPARTKVLLSVGPAAALDIPGLLASLDGYPYGCAEQTTSRALPLLYANALATASGYSPDPALKERIEQAISRVLEMQDSSGAFGVWGPSNGDMWLTSYVTDFLTRAREAGFVVPGQAFQQALDRLQNFIAYAQDFDKGGEARAYALYVLARNGRAPIGDLRYYADTRIDRFTTPLSQGQLGAALAMMGDAERAEKAFSRAISSVRQAEPAGYRIDYGTALRDKAGLIALASELKLAKTETPVLVRELETGMSTHSSLSTQEQAFALLAAKGLSDAGKSLKLTVNGAAHTGPFARQVGAEALSLTGLSVTNASDTSTAATITVVGAALAPEPPISRGFRIDRQIYGLDGKRLDDPKSGQPLKLTQGDRVVVVLRIEATQGPGRVMLVDRLPAGLEVENPHLVEGSDIKALDWLKTVIKPDHTEFRDDRFVAAFTVTGGKPAVAAQSGADTSVEEDATDSDNGSDAAGAKAERPTGNAVVVAYIARAVSPGTFLEPAASVEDMYRPERYARTAAGHVVIAAKP